MTEKAYSPLEYWRRRYLEEKPLLEWESSNEDFFSWKEKFREAFVSCLGRFPEMDVPLEPVVVETVDTETYTRKKVVYNADMYSKIPAYLFIPHDAVFPAPAVLCPHGHGRGKLDTAGIAYDERERKHIAGYNYNYAEQFAEAGYITLAPDLRCFGERTDTRDEAYGYMAIEEGDHWCDINFVRGMLLGYNLLTLHIFDIGRGIDYLQTLSVVDHDRIGCVGLSQGGTTTLFSSAYDERIRVVGVSGYLNSWRAFPIPTGQICGSQIVPGLLHYGDHAEVAGLICPRPMFIEFGTRDPIFPVEATRKTYTTVKSMYAEAGAADRLDCEEFDGVHEFRGRRIFDFFKKWL
jgi:cephalosporin-C deacetylase-like acetyl esterase